MLKRTLTFYDLLFIAIGNIIGGGVFSLMGRGISHGKGITWLLLLICGFIMWYMSMAYTDMSDKIKDNQSEYNIAKEFAGKRFASIYTLISMITSIAVATVISIAFAEHIKALGININIKWMATITLIIVGIINSLGIRESTTIINGMTMIEMSSLIVLMFVLPLKANVSELIRLPTTNGAIMVPLLMIFAFTGAEALSKLAGESVNPKDIPKAINTSIGITTIMYAMTCATMISILGVKNISQSITPMLDTYSSLYGPISKRVINAIALFSIFNTIMMSSVSASRSLYGYAIEKDIKELSFINKNKVPLTAIVICTCISIGLLYMTKSVEKLAIFSNIFIMFMLIVMNSVAYKNDYKSRNIISICIALVFILFGSKQLIN